MSTPITECKLCNPDFGGDCLCDDCIDKAAMYDLLNLNHVKAGLALRRMRQTLMLDMPILDFEGVADKASEYVSRIDALLNGEFADALALHDARVRQVEAVQQQMRKAG